jgi:hypothetical protein
MNSAARNASERNMVRREAVLLDSAIGSSVPAWPRGRPTVRVKGSTHPPFSRELTFYSSPLTRTPGGTKGLAPFTGMEVYDVR